MNRRGFLGICSSAWLVACAAPIGSDEPVVEDHTIASSDADTRLFLHNKRLRRSGAPRADRTVLFLHGLTYPGS